MQEEVYGETENLSDLNVLYKCLYLCYWLTPVCVLKFTLIALEWQLAVDFTHIAKKVEVTRVVLLRKAIAAKEQGRSLDVCLSRKETAAFVVIAVSTFIFIVTASLHLTNTYLPLALYHMDL
jgi:hypothetical protein